MLVGSLSLTSALTGPVIAGPVIAESMIAAALDVGDPAATRTVYTTVVVLAALGVLLGGLAIWVLRRTRPEPDLLSPLETMDTRRWRQLDPAAQRRSLDDARPLGASPLRREASEPAVDSAFATVAPVASFDDLTEHESDRADHEEDLDEEQDAGALDVVEERAGDDLVGDAPELEQEVDEDGDADADAMSPIVLEDTEESERIAVPDEDVIDPDSDEVDRSDDDLSDDDLSDDDGHDDNTVEDAGAASSRSIDPLLTSSGESQNASN